MDGSRDQFLACAGLATDQHRGVSRRDAPDVLQDAADGGALADNLFEVVVGLDLLLEIKILGLESGLLLLEQHAVGDIDKHGPSVFAVRLGLGPPLDPDRFSVVPAT